MKLLILFTIVAIVSAANKPVFKCKTKPEYEAELKATVTQCGIVPDPAPDKSLSPISIDENKACSDAGCQRRAEAMVAACAITNVGGDGAEELVYIIKKTCVEGGASFECRTEADYDAELKATHALCGLKVTGDKLPISIDKVKTCSGYCPDPAACSDAGCQRRAKAMAEACEASGRGGDGFEDAEKTIKKTCGAFSCEEKTDYIQEMNATHTLCGITATANKFAPVPIDQDKACLKECLSRAEFIVSNCSKTGVGGDGDELLVYLIKKKCNPFKCKSKPEYEAEMNATFTNCGISEDDRTIDRSKACVHNSEFCLERAEAIVAACAISKIGGNGDEQMVRLLKDVCTGIDPAEPATREISTPIPIITTAISKSSRTLVTPGVFVLIFAAVLQL